MSTTIESFIQESEDLIEESTKHLLALEIEPDSMPEIDGTIRFLHSLKALSRTIGIKWMGLTVHLAESILANIKFKRVSYSEEVGDVLFSVLDFIRENIHKISTGYSPPIYEILKIFGETITEEDAIQFILPDLPQSFLKILTKESIDKTLTAINENKILGILESTMSQSEKIEDFYNKAKSFPVDFIALLVEDQDNGYKLQIFVILNGNLNNLKQEEWNWKPFETALQEKQIVQSIMQEPLSKEPSLLSYKKQSKNPLEKLQKELLGEVSERLNNITGWVIKMEEAKDEKEKQVAFNELFRLVHSLKGTSLLYGFTVAGHAAGEMEEMLLNVKQSDKTLLPFQIDIVLKGIDTLRHAFPPTDNPKAPPPISLDEISTKMKQLSKSFNDNSISQQVEQSQPRTQKQEELIKIPRKRLDRLVALTGELVTSMESFERFSRTLDDFTRKMSKWSKSPEKESPLSLTTSASHLGFKFSMLLTKTAKLLTGLRQETLSARMVPIGQCLASFPRAVRDIARSLGKEAVLEMQGTETELDRTIAELLHDPLMHIIRNAVDHGIELPEVRAKSGKPKRGKIIIKARPQGNHIAIEITDDGQGINTDKIRKKAVENNLLSYEAAQAASSESLYELIFTPGFSTSQTVTEISGRGVGMDVVRTSIEEMKGSVIVSSINSLGTTFQLTVPLTLALLQGLFFKIGHEIMAVPSAFVKTVKKVHPDEIKRLEGKSMLQWGDAPILLTDLGELLGMGSAWRPMAIIASFGTMMAAFMVDEILEVQDMVLKDLGSFLSSLPLVTGSTMRHDGKITIVLDLISLMRTAHHTTTQALPEINKKEEKKPKRILLAEDSPTTRQLFSRLFTLAGYEVLEACDGLDALNIFKREPVDIVVSDCQMPRKDGLTLTREIKSISPHTPVVIMTALSKEEERLQGLDAGANAYIVKGTFKQQDLFQIVKWLTGEASNDNAG